MALVASNVSVASVEYGTKQDLYNRDSTGFFFTLQKGVTSTPIDSADQLVTEGLFVMSDILDISQLSHNMYLKNGSDQFGIIRFDLSQIIPDRENNTIFFYSGDEDSLAFDASPPYTDVQNALVSINESSPPFFLHNSSVQTIYDTSLIHQLHLTNLSYDESISVTGLQSTAIQLEGTILEPDGTPNSITEFTDAIQDGFFDIALFFQPLDIPHTTGATLQFSNTSTFDTVAIEVPMDSMDPTIPFVTKLNNLIDIHNNITTYIRISNTIETSYSFSMKYALFDLIQPTGLPLLVCQNATSTITVNPPPAYIEKLKQPPTFRNKKLAYVTSLPYLRNLSDTLIDTLRLWKANRNEVPSLNIANTFAKRIYPV